MEKGIFHPFSTHFCSQNGRFSRHFGIFHGPKRVSSISKSAKNTCLSTPNGRGSLLKNAFLTYFCAILGLEMAHFQGILGFFHGPSCAITGSKRPKNTCLSIPSGLGTFLGKIIFFAPGTLVDPPLAPTVPGPRCPPAQPTDHWYGALRVSLGDFEAWKPQKEGGCGWTRCPRNLVLSHIGQDTARFWFRACLTQTVHIQAIFGHFWAISRTYCGPRGQERALGHAAIEAHVYILLHPSPLKFS